MRKNKSSNLIDGVLILFIILITLTGGNTISNIVEINIFVFTALLYIFKNKHKGRIKKNSIVLLTLGICLYLLIDVAYLYNVRGTVGYICILLCMFELINCELKEDFIKKIIKYMNIYCIIVALSIIITSVYSDLLFKNFSFLIPENDLIQITKEYAKGYISGLAVGKAYAAFIMNIGIALTIPSLIADKKIKKRSMILLIIYFIGLMLTGKRTLFVVPIISVFALLIINKNNAKVSKIALFTFIALILLVIVINFIPSARVVIQRFVEDADDLETFNNRNYMWNNALKMYHNKPLMGYGINTYRTYITNIGVMKIMHAHNIYFQLLGETGIIGISLFMILFISGLVKNLKLIRDDKVCENKHYLSILNTTMYLQLLFLIYGLTGNDLYTFSQLFVYFLALAIMISIQYIVKLEKNKMNEENGSEE